MTGVKFEVRLIKTLKPDHLDPVLWSEHSDYTPFKTACTIDLHILERIATARTVKAQL